MKLKIVLVCIVLSACTERAGAPPVDSGRTQSPLFEIDDPNLEFNKDFPGILRPNELTFRKVVAGQEIVLHSAIVMPPLGEPGRLVIEFRRSDLEEAFVRGLFYDPYSDEIKLHPFASPGVEAVLTNEKLIVTVHQGVNLHFRNDMQSFPEYRTFTHDQVVGWVTDVKGNVLYSDQSAIIREKLNDIFTSIIYSGNYLSKIEGLEYRKLDDGTMGWVIPPGVEIPPKTYPPRVEVD